MSCTVYIRIKSMDDNTMLARTLCEFAKFRDAAIVDKPVDEHDNEANIAVVNTCGFALFVVKETENTIVLIACSTREQKDEANAFVVRFPRRVKICPSFDEHEDFVTVLSRTIAQVNGEVTS